MENFLNYQGQIAAIHWMQSSPLNYLQSLWVVLNNLDTKIYYFSLAILISIFFKRFYALRMWWLLALAIYFTSFLKFLTGLPRPLTLDPSVGLVLAMDNLGLPSGGAMMAMIIGLYFYKLYPNKIMAVVCVLYVLFASFCRVYIGMHFFTDIIGGWLVGFLLFYGRCGVEFFFANISVNRVWSAVLTIGFSLGLYFIYDLGPSFKLLPVMIGIGLGHLLYFEVETPTDSPVDFNARKLAMGFLMILIMGTLEIVKTMPLMLIGHVFMGMLATALIFRWSRPQMMR